MKPTSGPRIDATTDFVDETSTQNRITNVYYIGRLVEHGSRPTVQHYVVICYHYKPKNDTDGWPLIFQSIYGMRTGDNYKAVPIVIRLQYQKSISPV